jgi:hypothetical protein
MAPWELPGATDDSPYANPADRVPVSSGPSAQDAADAGPGGGRGTGGHRAARHGRRGRWRWPSGHGGTGDDQADDGRQS